MPSKKIVIKVIRLGLQPDLYEELRSEAKRQRVTVSGLIELMLTEMKLRRKITPRLSQPVVQWTPDEAAEAHESMRVFCAEDR
jgi:hypothetical protein